ncbi:hypothetical protein V2W45_1242176, partial [Cenococcum geophilum]
SLVVYRPLSNIQYIAYKKCKKRFSCSLALLYYLKSGSCCLKIMWWKLNKAV